MLATKGVRTMEELADLAIDELTEPCRTLIRLCLVDPPLQYDELADLMDVAPGTIGPRRRRCLRRLEHSLGTMFDDKEGL